MLGLMGDDKTKGLASILISKMGGEEYEMPSDEGYDGEIALEDAAMNIIKAVKEDDPRMLASYLKEAVRYCMMKYGDKGTKIEMEF